VQNQGNAAYMTLLNNRHWMSAGDWLRTKYLLPFWHDISMADIHRGSQDATWLNHREQQVRHEKNTKDRSR
jgi:hypothetical protein